PVFDFAYILIARILKGETRTVRQVVEHCATDHLSHRLVWLGFSQRRAVLFIYMMALALGLAGIMFRNSTRGFDSALGLAQGAAIVALIVVLMVTAGQRQATLERRVHEIRPLTPLDDEATPEDLRKSA